MYEGLKTIRIICKIDARRHGNRLESKSMNVMREYNGAFSEGEKNMVCHPLDRNSLQMQD